ncbi:PfkB family carbohydrate kinase [Streptomyces sp. NBC_00310]|uniref:sugar kinase n=1 Tax=Streptomyces sp. NBC_00310 TaxID=2903645 RepID=UPI003FA73BFE
MTPGTDVVALGESMVTFLPTRPGRLADVPSFERAIGGAESNVACALAAAGHTVRWVSRVGADGFGDHLVETIGGHGVDVTSVERDPARPTGVYFRTAGDRATDAHEVAYYRAGSAASAMSARTVDLAAVRAGRVLHLSGITAALSGDCLRLLRELTAPHPGRPLISFDVNHRPGLWHDADGPRVLLELARAADLVFVGEDEAKEVWGITGGPTAVRRLLPEPDVLVVKQGARGATLFRRGPGRGRAEDGRAESGWADSGRAEGSQPGQDGFRPVDGGGGGGGGEAEDGPADPGGSRPMDGGIWPTDGGSRPVGASGTHPGSTSALGTSAREASALGTPGLGTPAREASALGASALGASALGSSAREASALGSSALGASAREASALGTPAHETFVPALDVEVVATIGAGDAFAAGFLSATLRGLPDRARLRHGHLMAAAALTVPGDLAAPPSRDLADRLAALSDEAWGRLRLGPGWTQADQAPEEVRTP